MAQTKRRAEPTHPTVWGGLGLALAGLSVALYAYTGPRVYDIAYFFAAIVGGVLAVAGILVAAWGRALGQARRQRERRLNVAGSQPAAEAARPPPTQAAHPEKKSLLARLRPPRPAASGKPVFAFKRRGSPEGAAAAAATEVETAPGTPQRERVTLQCPECSTTFSDEGVRPFEVKCPQCAFSAEV